MRDMYSDSDTETMPSKSPMDKPKPKGDGGKTTIVPLDFFGPEPPKPGDKVEVEVVRVHDDSIEVMKCEDHESAEDDQEEAPPASPGGTSPASGPSPGGGLYE